RSLWQRRQVSSTTACAASGAAGGAAGLAKHGDAIDPSASQTAILATVAGAVLTMVRSLSS
ncbi:MAG: hypothetical protein OXG35_13170, partial [Acidobacteria bacterium]|nr:hypothetical protein [Acidobacteriota bacterium]